MLTGITEEELFPADIDEDEKTIWNALLFPVTNYSVQSLSLSSSDIHLTPSLETCTWMQHLKDCYDPLGNDGVSWTTEQGTFELLVVRY